MIDWKGAASKVCGLVKQAAENVWLVTQSAWTGLSPGAKAFLKGFALGFVMGGVSVGAVL